MEEEVVVKGEVEEWEVVEEDKVVEEERRGGAPCSSPGAGTWPQHSPLTPAP